MEFMTVRELSKSPKDTLKLKFIQNLSEMRLASLQNGISKMSLDEINAEITAVRKKRKKTLR